MDAKKNSKKYQTLKHLHAGSDMDNDWLDSLPQIYSAGVNEGYPNL